jgi:hypothetical protein
MSCDASGHFYNPIDDTLLHTEDEQYTIRRRMVHDFDKDEDSAISQDQPLPPKVYPVAVVDRPNTWTMPFTNAPVHETLCSATIATTRVILFDLMPNMQPWGDALTHQRGISLQRASNTSGRPYSINHAS